MSHWGDRLGAYLDGEVDEQTRTLIAEHLTGCGVCRSELADISWARSVVRDLPIIELPPGIVPGVFASWRRRRRAFRPAWAWAASAVTAAALTLGLVIAPGQADSTFELGSLVDRHVARVVLDPGISAIRGPVSGP